ncbi:hypothetical protein JTB14_001168 [Gonioctena quinquepunctata]|nr:hypothetical protein JTB14_001168 [Gonioctena quinquepunctata]
MVVSFKKSIKLLVIFLFIVNEIVARPGAEWVQDIVCDGENITTTQICQLCAKKTKSPVVYPMCCKGEDDVYNWCLHYIDYPPKLP